MHIVVVMPSREERDRASACLFDAGHALAVATDRRAALALLEQQVPDVLLIDWQMPGASEVIKRARSLEGPAHVYIVATTQGRSTAEYVAAVCAGADAYIRKPLEADELLLHVGAMDRIRGWAGRLSLTPLSSRDWSSGPHIPGLRAWKEADRAFARGVEGMLGESLVATPTFDMLSGIDIGAEIPLSLAAEEIEVRITVGLSLGALRHVAGVALGDENAPESALRDVVRELANMAAGALKQTAIEEGVVLTMGLPTDLDLSRLRIDCVSAQQEFLLRATGRGPLDIGLKLAVRSKKLTRMTVAQLREGMVVARDILSDAGAVLVPSGTRLTKSQIEKMSRMLSPKSSVNVADAA